MEEEDNDLNKTINNNFYNIVSKGLDYLRYADTKIDIVYNEIEPKAEQNYDTKPIAKRKPKISVINNSKEQKAMYYCHICKDDEKLTRSQLKEHSLRHGMSAKDFCQKFFLGARSRQKRIKRQPPSYKCEVCSEILENQVELDQHLGSHDNQFFCDVCNAGFKILIDYAYHVQVHSEDKLFRCPLCSITTESRYYIKAHLYTVHDQFKKYKCEICSKSYSNYSYLQEHKYFHTGEKPFQCDVCQRQFMYSRYLYTHKLRQHAEQQLSIECYVCKKICKSKLRYANHIRNHNTPGRVCDVCGKTFKSGFQLKAHQYAHKGEKPFKCSFCNKSFTLKVYKVDHERTHTGEKPFKCPRCDKCFAQRTSMNRHQRCHKQREEYICFSCKASFVAKAMLIAHLKTYCKGAVSNSFENE